MKIASLLIKSTLVSSAFVFAVAPSLLAVASTVTITPTSSGDWSEQTVAPGTFEFINGDAPAALGKGSLKLTTPTAESKSSYAQNLATAIPLSSVNAMSYWTKQVQASAVNGSASMQVGLDLNGDTTWDTTLVYEPSLQRETPWSVDPLVPIQKGVWQQWNVDLGMFWSTESISNLGSPLELIGGDGTVSSYTLQDIKDGYPNAIILGYGVNVGVNAPGFDIRVDGVRLGDITYDFEYSSLYTPPAKDLCKDDGWINLKTSEGIKFKNQGQCVSYTVPQ